MCGVDFGPNGASGRTDAGGPISRYKGIVVRRIKTTRPL
jgi:hypothetical protein